MSEYVRTPVKNSSQKLALAAIGATALAVGTLALSGCPSGSDWSDYDGVNLIEERQFGATDENGDDLWYFADGLTTGTSAPYDYVQFEEVDGTVYGSLPSGTSGPVYRLEVVNLFTDGTFEEGSLGAAWTSYTANPTVIDDSSTDPAPIEGWSLYINATDNESRLAIDLAAALLDSSFDNGELYSYHLDFQMGIQTFGLEYNDNVALPVSVIFAPEISRGEGSSDAYPYAFPGSLGENPDIVDAGDPVNNQIQQEDGYTHLSFGGFSAGAQLSTINAVIDNIRFVRADQNHLLRVPVPYRESGRPRLVSGGSYTIRVWARNDPTTLSAAEPNRFPARFLSAGIDPRIGSTVTVDKTRAVTASARSYVGDLTGWEQFEFSVPGDSITIPSSTDGDDVVLDVVFEIGHSSAGSFFRDAGAILLTAPELEWSPNSL